MTDPNPFLPGAGPTEPELPPASIAWAADSVSGTKKPTNDDSWLAFSSGLHGASLLEKGERPSLAEHDLIFAISDGMGGGNAGNVASNLILKSLSRLIPKTFKSAAAGLYPDYLSRLEEVVRDVHEAINWYAEEAEEKKGMAATLVLTWFTPENLYVANVGDSRLYLHRRLEDGTEENQQLTQDHTFVWKQMNRGDITEREYRNHPRRPALYEVVGGGHPTVNPYVAAIPYHPGDRFLLCSDGLVDGLWQKHIAEGFSENPDSPSALIKALMSRSNENDMSDDTTLIALSIHTAENV